MPEEINRKLTDAISDVLFCSEPSGMENLAREGVAPERCHLVGNVMIDTLLTHLERAKDSTLLSELGVDGQGHAVLTLHRPANVDDPEILGRILDAVEVVQREMPIIFPIHPRTLRNFKASSLNSRMEAMKNLRLIEPVGYLDFLNLVAKARVVLTDSGGIQEETTILNVPCLTLRENTERPVTVQMGSNQIVGTDPERIVAAYRQIMSAGGRTGQRPPLWDGHAAERIVKILSERLD
jgi:UDP-N-acetylglucosamine 2-epimerase (non-hydrolysing)